MLTKQQLTELALKSQAHQTVVAREYLQLIILNELFGHTFSRQLYFKGGTAIRLVYYGTRFSEDLDFTVHNKQAEFEPQLKHGLIQLQKLYGLSLKHIKPIAGLRYRLGATWPVLPTPIFIRLDFSFREKVLDPQAVEIKTDYPIAMSNLVNVLSLDELLTEKIRAVLNRLKSRDLYDLWLLRRLGATLRRDLLNQKLALDGKVFDVAELKTRLKLFTGRGFKQDLGAFLPQGQRQNIEQLYHDIQLSLTQWLNELERGVK